MIDRDYYLSDAVESEASVLACEKIGDGECWSIELNRTIFHPKGGGQLADDGWIEGRRVLAVEIYGDVIRHIVAEPIALGSVHLRINAQTRSLHARLHSAGHLIGNIGSSFGMIPVKAQHWPGAAWVSFQCEDGRVPDLDEMGKSLRALIDRNLVRVCEFKDGFRIVGFGGLPAFPCGGTHVGNLAEIGEVRLLAIKRKKSVVTIPYDLS